MPATDNRPRVALTMGDVAGIGPEVIARAWSDPDSASASASPWSSAIPMCSARRSRW